GALRLLCELRKCRRTGDGEFRQALAIERDAGVLQTADELAVAQTVFARRRVDADDPQPAEIALLPAPADERVFQRGVDRFFGGAIQFALVRVIALGQPQQLLALGPPDCSSFDAWHRLLPDPCSLPNPESLIPNPCSRRVICRATSARAWARRR